MKEPRTISTEITEKDLRVARIRESAKSIFTSDEAVARWLASPAPALGDVKPVEAIATEAGARAVEALIEGIAHGNVM